MDKTTLRPLIFIECAEPGGAEKVVLLLSEEFRARGAEPVIVCLERGWLTERLEERGLRCIVLRSEISLDVTLPFRLAGIVRRERCNVLHSHLLDSNFYGSWAARLAGVPHLGTDHGDAHLASKKRLRRTKLRLASLTGSSFTAVSAFTARRMIELGVPDHRIAVLGNPVEAPYQCTGEERADVRRELGADADTDWLWMHAAMLRPVKDQKTLLKGFAEAVRTSAVSQILVIAGDGPERGTLEQHAQDLGIAEQVRFLGVRNDIPRLLSSCDGFVLTSLSEALPLVLLEAASAGLPIISTHVGGVGELIEHGVNGLTCNSEDEKGLAELMKGLCEDSALSRSLAERAKRMADEQFSSGSVTQAFLDIFTNLLARRPAFEGLTLPKTMHLG